MDLTQILQLTQSDSIILILYVDDNKKLDCSKLRAPAPRVLSSKKCFLIISKILQTFILERRIYFSR